MTDFTPAELCRLGAAALSWDAANLNREDERRHRWQSAATAFRVVGKRDGATDRLSKLLAIETEAVRQMASGYSVFYMLYKMDCLEAKKLRRKHGYTRFYEVGALWAKYNFDVELLFEYLNEDVSAASIRDTITDHHDPLPKWHRKAVGMLPAMKNFEEWGGVSLRLRRLARLWKAEVEKL